MIDWPDGKSFAFTVFDDTDNSTVENITPLYDLLAECGLRTTKSVWTYPPRDFFTGGCLEDSDYLNYVRVLQKSGFEIASHGVGSGKFSRQEIIDGIEKFNQLLGFYPYLYANHARNSDLIYWGHKRFTYPMNWLYHLVQKRTYHGDEEGSEYFWGDLCKKHIKYIRNRTFQEVNTGKCDQVMPYIERTKTEYANFWFSSSDGHTIAEFNELIRPENIDRLEQENGFCIVYTHFASGFVDDKGCIDRMFQDNIKELSKRNGWFVPVGELLDFLLTVDGRGQEVSYPNLLRLDLYWLFERINKKVRFGR